MLSRNADSNRHRLGLVITAAISLAIGLSLSSASNSQADDVGIGDKNVQWGWGIGEGPAGNYDFPNENCEGNQTDPVGVLFVGKRAGTANVGWHLEMHNGLDRGVGVENFKGEKHSLLVRNDKGGFDCKVLNTANANAGATSDRHHIRLWGIPGSEFPEVMTVGTPHHEDFLNVFQGCSPANHAVDENGSVDPKHGFNASGYDWARHEVGWYFSHPNSKNSSSDYLGGNHRVVSEYWGNTEEFPQCDGENAASDGSGLVIWINKKTDPRTSALVSASETKAVLSGQFAGDGTVNEWWFGYGTKSAQGVSAYQETTPVEVSSSEGEVEVDATAPKLASNTKYYARLFVRTDDGEVEEGPEVSFRTRTRPVAAYSFDDGEGEVAEDLFGEHDGAIEGADWFDNGRYGKALSFDGAEEDCVTVPDAPELQLTEEFTLQAWVKPRGDGNDEPILFKEQSPGWGGYAIYFGLDDQGNMEGLISDEGEFERTVTTTAQVMNVWTHVALTYDGAHMRLYVDGELADTTSVPGVEPTNGPLSIGCSDELDDFFNGLIDEVRVYNRALGGDEIAIDQSTPLQTLERDPVAAYAFDEGVGALAFDFAGEHHGTIEGATWFDNGRYGKALSFNGVDNCVTVEDAPDLQLSEEFTLEAWVKPQGSLAHDPVIFKEDEGENSYALGIGLTQTGRVEGWIEGDSVYSPGSLQANVWSHLAFSYDGARFRLYLNGELVSDKHVGSDELTSNGPLHIGCAPAFEEEFKGLIDDPRIYNRALGAGEVAADMGAGLQTPSRSPVAAYSFDAGEGEVAEDLFGEHDGTIEGATWFDNGRYGKALLFDGPETCVTVPHAAELDLGEEMTLEAWVKPHALSDQPIIYKSAWGNLGYGLGTGIFNTAKPEGFIGEGPGKYEDVVSPEAIAENVWSHLALTYDGANMRLYVNGELVATQAQSTPPPTGEGPLALGCNPLYPEDFDGLMDEVRIYDRALGGDEIAIDKAGPFPN